MSTPSHGMTEAELASLTEEERAGLLEGEEEEEEEGEELKPDPESKSDHQSDPKPDPTKEAESDPAKDPAEKVQEGRDDGQNVEVATRPPVVPLISGELPADFKERMDALDTRENELVDKFEEGDITTKEYNAELRKINKDRGDLDWLERKAELSQETTKGQVDRDWYGEVDVFLKEHPEILLNKTRTNSYDAIVLAITAETMKAGKQPGRADLVAAHKQWADDLGISVKPADPARKGPKNIPPTLGGVPSAEITETDDGKYAQLDRLAETDPIAYEREIAKMSEADFNAYSQSS